MVGVSTWILGWVGIGLLESPRGFPIAVGIGGWPQNGVEKIEKKKSRPEMVWEKRKEESRGK